MTLFFNHTFWEERAAAPACLTWIVVNGAALYVGPLRELTEEECLAAAEVISRWDRPFGRASVKTDR